METGRQRGAREAAEEADLKRKYDTLYFHMNGRRNGMTTALLDIAIATAKTGETVQFWNKNDSGSDHAARVMRRRLEETGDIGRASFHVRGGIRVITFVTALNATGKVEFRNTAHNDDLIHGLEVDASVGMDVYDFNARGTVRRRANIRN